VLPLLDECDRQVEDAAHHKEHGADLFTLLLRRVLSEAAGVRHEEVARLESRVAGDERANHAGHEEDSAAGRVIGGASVRVEARARRQLRDREQEANELGFFLGDELVEQVLIRFRPVTT